MFAAFPHIQQVLPAVGYAAADLRAIADTANASSAEVIVNGSPADLASLVSFDAPVVRARYRYANADEPYLSGLVDRFLAAKLT